MQADMWYDLALRALSREDTIAELLREAETAQLGGNDDEVEDDSHEELEPDHHPMTAW
jgi:hypothetical protein